MSEHVERYDNIDKVISENGFNREEIANEAIEAHEAYNKLRELFCEQEEVHMEQIDLCLNKIIGETHYGQMFISHSFVCQELEKILDEKPTNETLEKIINQKGLNFDLLNCTVVSINQAFDQCLHKTFE